MSQPTHYSRRPNSRHSIIAKNIILALSTPLVVAITPFSTRGRWTKDAEDALDALENFFFPGEEEIDEAKIRRSLYNLKNRGYVKYKYSEDKKTLRVELTKKGQKVARVYKIDLLTIDRKQKWDGQWRFVMFDIPEKQRYAREILRDKLKILGFFRIQRSVYVFPYSCEKEIDLLSEYFGLRSHVLVFTGAVNRDIELRTHFKKLGFHLRK